MINFNCAACGKAFSVPDEAAGRVGKCNKCGHRNQVPAASVATAPPSARSTILAPTPQPPAIPPPPALEPPAVVAAPVMSQPIPAASSTVVVVAQPPRRSNSTAIASLIVAVVAFVFCWIPLLGLISIPVALLALLLGGIGLLVALFRRGAGIGFSIAGVVLSLVALVIPITMTKAMVDTAAVVSQQIDRNIADRNATNQTVVPPTQSDLAAPAAQPPVTASEGAAAAIASPEKPEAQWADARNPVQQDEVRIAITGVKVDYVHAKTFDGTSQSKEKLLQIAISVDNLSKSKKLEFEGFSGSDFGLRDSSPHLEDNFGNRYKQVTFGFGHKVEGQAKNESVYPGQSSGDVLVFEVPVDQVQFLHLELPATAFGGTGKLRFEITREMIRGAGE